MYEWKERWMDEMDKLMGEQMTGWTDGQRDE